uniref:DUF2333 family protein n=1 Tax=Desulfatirhabdium butyrativorans TaxID=340467 RepID=A0A7C4RTP6_9BACT
MDKLKHFMTQRVVVGTILAIALLWMFQTVIGLLYRHPEGKPTGTTETVVVQQPAAAPQHSEKTATQPHETSSAQGQSTGTEHAAVQQTSTPASAAKPSDAAHGETPAASSHQGGAASSHGQTAQVDTHGTKPAAQAKHVPGVAFIHSVVKPLRYELDERFWGWRPNDILNVTDNVNNFQLGVLETTRRTIVILAEKISRTGSVEAFDKNVEHAMDWIMTKPDRYWFPSPEDRYTDALNDLLIYADRLQKGMAQFYTRADNIIPLLQAYINLIGSCEENLVKETEPWGEPVSWFRVDDYFYYSKGVAAALYSMLEGVENDFHQIIETRRGTGLLHHAIESCKRASEIEPWMVTDADLGGILANHRANMAAPLSHVRFYLEMLVAALST